MIDILEGSPLQPLQPITLLPVADEVPDAVTSNWAWLQAKQGSYTADVPPSTILAFASNGTAAVSSLDCGKATGTFAADAESQLALYLVRCSVTGRVGKPPVQLLDILDAVDTWRFESGGLVITVAEGDGEIVFAPPPWRAEEDSVETCSMRPRILPKPGSGHDIAGKVTTDLFQDCGRIVLRAAPRD